MRGGARMLFVCAIVGRFAQSNRTDNRTVITTRRSSKKPICRGMSRFDATCEIIGERSLPHFLLRTLPPASARLRCSCDAFDDSRIDWCFANHPTGVLIVRNNKIPKEHLKAFALRQFHVDGMGGAEEFAACRLLAVQIGNY